MFVPRDTLELLFIMQQMVPSLVVILTPSLVVMLLDMWAHQDLAAAPTNTPVLSLTVMELWEVAPSFHARAVQGTLEVQVAVVVAPPTLDKSRIQVVD